MISMEKKKLPKSYMKIVRLIGQEPTFENLCIYMSQKNENQTTGEFMNILWWLWCETYPEERKNLIHFKEKHLAIILNYLNK